MSLNENISKIKALMTNFFKDYDALTKQRERIAQERDRIASQPKDLASLIAEAHDFVDEKTISWRKKFAERTLEIRFYPQSTMKGSAAITEWFKGPWTGQFAPEVNPDALMFFFSDAIKKVLTEEIKKLPEPKNAIANHARKEKLDDLDAQIAELDAQIKELDRATQSHGLQKPLPANCLTVDLDALAEQIPPGSVESKFLHNLKRRQDELKAK